MNFTVKSGGMKEFEFGGDFAAGSDFVYTVIL